VELKVRDVARLLNVSEQTVYRWVRNRSLPAHRVHDQYHFNRVELQEWAALHKHRVSPELFAPNGSSKELPSLCAAIERGGIFYGVPGESRDEVLAAVTRLPGIPAGVDRQLLHQLLVAREALASTSVGDGIAVPHPRDPVVVHVDQPAVLLCFLERPVDFGALDGRPVRVLCMLLSPSVRDHLQMLARLAAALHDETFKELLHAAAPREGILNRLRAVEGERGL
jgi:PTS system nitrogen regulatory IIA component